MSVAKKPVLGRHGDFCCTRYRSADFTENNLVAGYGADTLYLFHDGRNGVTEWSWLFDGVSSTDQNPMIVYK